MNFVRYTVSMKRLVLMRYPSIAEWMSVACPRPTFVCAAPINIFPKLFSERYRTPMVINVSLWLAFYHACLSVAFLGNRRGLTTTAHAKPAWVGAFGERLLKHIMTANELVGLTLNHAQIRVGFFGYLGLLSTTAVAITVGNFSRGIMEGHGNLPFLCQSLGRRKRRQALSIGVLPVHFSTGERFMQPNRAFSMAGLPLFA